MHALTEPQTIRTCNVPGTSETALRLLALRPGSRVLDLGCYQGDISRHLLSKGHAVSSCDVVAYESTAQLPDFGQVDANLPLPYAGDFFDAILCTEVIEHLENPTSLLRECARILRSGGILVLSTPNVGNVLSRLHFLLRGEFPQFRRYHFTNWNHLSPVTPLWLEWTATKHGLHLDIATCEPPAFGWKRCLLQALGTPLLWLAARRQRGALLKGQTLILRFVKK